MPCCAQKVRIVCTTEFVFRIILTPLVIVLANDEYLGDLVSEYSSLNSSINLNEPWKSFFFPGKQREILRMI